MTIHQIDFKAGDAVRAALAEIGRTEDLRFSPDNRLLAIAGYARKRCLVLRVDVETGPDGPGVTLHNFMELTSDSMGEIHGLDFIDDRTLRSPTAMGWLRCLLCRVKNRLARVVGSRPFANSEAGSPTN